MKTTPWEHLKAASEHEQSCQRWPHRLRRRLEVPFPSRWNRWGRDVAEWLCDPYTACECRLCAALTGASE